MFYKEEKYLKGHRFALVVKLPSFIKVVEYKIEFYS